MTSGSHSFSKFGISLKLHNLSPSRQEENYNIRKKGFLVWWYVPNALFFFQVQFNDWNFVRLLLEGRGLVYETLW